MARAKFPAAPNTAVDTKLPVWQSWFDLVAQFFQRPTWPEYKVATLPTDPVPYEGQFAYATNGRKTAEGAGLGTGVPVYYSQGVWRVFSTDAAVTA